MTFKPVSNWRKVLRKAWSVRLMIVAGILSGGEVALPLLDQVIEIPRGLFAAASGLTVSAAFIARLMAQKGIRDGDQ